MRKTKHTIRKPVITKASRKKFGGRGGGLNPATVKKIDSMMHRIFVCDQHSRFDTFRRNYNGLGYEFWFLHGVNFIVVDGSDTWEPLFPEIYEDGSVNRDIAYYRVMSLCMENNVMSRNGAMAILWMSLKIKEMFCIVDSIVVGVHKRGGNPHKQCDHMTWQMIKAISTVLLESCDNWGNNYEPWDMEKFLASAPEMIDRSLIKSIMDLI